MAPGRPPCLPNGGTGLKLIAPAKINLSLEVIGRRRDGFHDIASIIQAIDLVDQVGVGVAPGSGIRLSVSGAELATDARNLAWRAAHQLLEAVGLADPGAGGEDASPAVAVTIELEKRIPIAAGLGGGSADAAAVLLGLNHLLGRPLGVASLFRLAADLGSDIPFFLVGGTCFAGGRGERIRRLPPLPPLWVVVVSPAVAVETQWAYEARASEELTATGAWSRILESAIRQGSVSGIARALVNDLEQAVARRYVVVEEVLQRLREGEMLGARMSGSGSSAFALVGNRGEALRLAEALRGRNHPVIVCRPFCSGCGQLSTGRPFASGPATPGTSPPWNGG
jgi:4-diphosphocytidyl-2-C-methyl-D-erythritol kinase